jgi:integrase
VKLSKAVHEFTEGIRAIPGRSETAKTYGSSLQALVNLARPDSVLAFDHSLVERFFQSVSSQAQNTVYKHGTALRQFGKWGKRRGYWTTDPMDDPQFSFRQEETLPKPFTEDEAARLMALPLDGVHRVARALLYYTALRVTPVVNLRISDLNFSPLRFEAVSLPGSIVATKNKGGKSLLIPMVPELHAVLSEWVAGYQGKSYDPVLHRPDGRPFNRSAVERWAAEWGRLAGVPRCHPHRFRHYLATDLLRRGVRLEVIQKLLGHVSIATTQRYTKLGDAETMKALLARNLPIKN